MTTRVGLLGWPVGHSISPAIHNAAYATQGLDWHYTALAVPPDELEARITSLVDEEDYRGFNITIPHKQAVLSLPQVHESSPAAQEIGAANVLTVLPGGGFRADNTDWQGFIHDLRMYRVKIEGANCMILGSGGSSRAIVYALQQSGAASITVISRDPAGKANIVGYDKLPELIAEVQFVVNCTPLGMTPDVDRSPWPENVSFPRGVVLYDLIYNPPVTRLMAQARSAGARVINGLGMLVWQAAFTFEQWTGSKPPLDIMFGAAKTAMEHHV